ncbi:MULTISPECIES: hypothetical protein [unclassified Variovorax]|uniref:hypothetical protein n=1 Tax=unclassified Variovorax TaxID=663243 RepID=UPI003F484622
MSKVSTHQPKTATPVTKTVTAVATAGTAVAGTTTAPTTEPTAATAVTSVQENTALLDLLDQAETIASLLAHNFGGDGSFDEPGEAPGLVGMVQCVASLLVAANEVAVGFALTDAAQDAILQARSLAEHLEAQSQEDLYNGKRGFRLGDRFISMCYWTVEKLAKSAHEVLA